MNNMNIEVYKIKERLPEDGQQCWVKSVNRNYETMQVFNKEYNCWDTFDGDDYDFDINDNDIYIELPSL